MKTTSRLQILVKPKKPRLTANNAHNIQMVRAHILAVRDYYRHIHWGLSW